MMLGPRSIPEAFAAAVERYGAAPLVVEGDRALSFVDIDRQSDGVAAALIAAGIRHGDRVALYCPNGAAFVSAYLGIVKAGAVVVPVNLLIQAAEAAYVLRDAGVSGVIYHAALAEKLAGFRTSLGEQRCWIRIGARGEQPGELSFDEACRCTRPAVLPEIQPLRDLAAILYTSGTTGRPKGAMLTHHNLVSNTESVREALAFEAGRDRLLVVLPMFHSFAATVGMLTPALHGLSLVPVAGFDPVAVSDAIVANACTVFLGVPSMYNVIQRIDDTHAAKWRSITLGVAGGAAMPVDLLQRFEARFGFPVLEGDGPTECSPVTCVNPRDGVRKPASVGVAVPGVAIAIFDELGHALAKGEIGEICVRGPNVMKGYWELPDATAEVFFGEWLRTGDLGYVDTDGYVFMVDRKKDMVIVNGMNVYPRMIEEVLYQHPAVLEAAVVGEPNARHGEIVVAYLVANDGAAVADADMRDFCRRLLGPHQVPRRFEWRDNLPKNATGKILKRELRRAGEIERGVDLSR